MRMDTRGRVQADACVLALLVWSGIELGYERDGALRCRDRRSGDDDMRDARLSSSRK